MSNENTAVVAEAGADTVISTTGFVTVPETTLPNGTVVPAFQIGQFHCAKGDNGNAVINRELAPWVEINYADARAACADIGASLITETQALALAWNVYNVAANWSGNAVGEGTLLMGLHDDYDLDEAPTGAYEHPDADQRRGFLLSNGETVFDVAGCVYTWVFDDVQGNEDGIVARAFAEDSPSITTAPHPSMEKGMGWYPPAGRDWSGSALIRCGCWCSRDCAGVCVLSLGWPDFGDDRVGFRCTKPIGV
jgi:hypothetical protein